MTNVTTKFERIINKNKEMDKNYFDRVPLVYEFCSLISNNLTVATIMGDGNVALGFSSEVDEDIAYKITEEKNENSRDGYEVVIKLFRKNEKKGKERKGKASE